MRQRVERTAGLLGELLDDRRLQLHLAGRRQELVSRLYFRNFFLPAMYFTSL